MNMHIFPGDITLFPGDAIVNAASPGLRKGRGVCGAIHRAGGAAIAASCRDIIRRQGALSSGQAVLTTAGDLPCRYVIHAVGPRWYYGLWAARQDALLAQTYRASLTLAKGAAIRHLAFPCISTGHYGYPAERAAAVAVMTVREYLKHHDMTVTFVCSDERDVLIYRRLLATTWSVDENKTKGAAR